MTNADLIRQMTDEELLEFLRKYEIGDYGTDIAMTFCSWCIRDIPNHDCDDCLRSWLKTDCKEFRGMKHYDWK